MPNMNAWKFGLLTTFFSATENPKWYVFWSWTRKMHTHTHAHTKKVIIWSIKEKPQTMRMHNNFEIYGFYSMWICASVYAIAIATTFWKQKNAILNGNDNFCFLQIEIICSTIIIYFVWLFWYIQTGFQIKSDPISDNNWVLQWDHRIYLYLVYSLNLKMVFRVSNKWLFFFGCCCCAFHSTNYY